MVFHPRERGARRPRVAGIPRRDFIRLSMLGAATAGFGPALLAACGGDDDDAAAGGVQLSRPDNPVTLPTFDDVKPIEDGLPIESGNAQGVQLPGVHLARRARRVRGRVRGDGRGHHVHQHGRGHRQALVGRHPVRRVLPDGRRDREGRGRQAAAAAQQELHPQHHERVGVAAGSVLRQGRRLLGAVHALLDRHRLSRRRRGEVARHVRQPVRHLLGHREQWARCTCSRTTARSSAWRCCAVARPTSTPRTPS